MAVALSFASPTVVGSGKNGNSATITWTSIDVTSVSNPVVVVLVAIQDVSASDTMSSLATSAGLSGTGSVVVSARGGDSYVTLGVIPAPSGNGTVTATITTSRPYQAQLLCFSGADQTTPCPTGAGNTNTATGAGNFSISAANVGADDAMFGCGCNATDGDDPSWDSGTESYYDNFTSVNMAGGYRLGNGAATMNWGAASSNKAMAIARVVSASVSAHPPLLHTSNPMNVSVWSTS